MKLNKLLARKYPNSFFQNAKERERARSDGKGGNALLHTGRKVHHRMPCKEAAKAILCKSNAPWGGDVCELGNFMERCVILTQGNQLNVPRLEVKDSAGRQRVPVASSFREAERRVIINALNGASGRIAGKGEAAERLGLKRTALQNKMRRLSIGRNDYSADQFTNRIAGPQATS